MISVYAPTHGKDEEFLECISYLTEFILVNKSENDFLAIGADSNCSHKSTSRRRTAWKTFCESFTLKQVSGTEPTFHHHNGTSESCIDVILLSNNLRSKDFQQFCTLDSPANVSSHDVLLSTLSLPIPETKQSKFKHTYTNFNREKIIWDEERIPEYQAVAAKALSEAEEFWNKPEYIPLLCSLYSIEY